MNILIHAHSGLRWVALILLLVTVFKALAGWRGKKHFVKSDQLLSSLTVISLHIMLVLGLALYVFGPNTKIAFATEGMMGNSFARFWAIEHIVGMLVGIFFVTMGRVRMKRAIDEIAKHKFIFIYYLIGLLLILASIPWPFRGVGGGWY